MSNVVTIHMAQSYDDGNAGLIIAMDKNNQEVQCRRSWACTINIVQMEDCNGYGFQFWNILAFSSSRKACMTTWTLCSILFSVKELWQAVNFKPEPF